MFTGSSRFPSSLRQMICQSVEQIPIEDMEQILSKHETDPENFDGRIEANLRNNLPNASIIPIGISSCAMVNQRADRERRANSNYVLNYDCSERIY